MSASGQSYAIATDESEQGTFFRSLFHDDRNSRYVLSTDAGGSWADTALTKEQVRRYGFNSNANYYITHNGFTGKRRQTERTRQLNALFFDLDGHGLAPESCELVVDRALNRITDAIEDGNLPMPTLIVHSGRGLHLYYVLQRSIPYRLSGSGNINEKGLALFSLAQERLADVLEKLLDGISGIQVDRAVFDHTRVSRIPGTYNRKAGRFARLLAATGTYCHLADLVMACAPAKQPQIAPSRKPASIMNFHPLMMSRLGKVAELQAYRKFDCEGKRELMSFVYYNTAVQIYGREEAKQLLERFNSRFKNPLPASELRGIHRTVDGVTNVKGEKGHYLLKAQTLVQLLGLTEREMQDLNFFASKRLTERIEAKRKTKAKREARNQAILDLYQAGSITQQEVAAEIGCSLRTVQSVLKAAGTTRAYTRSQKARKPLVHTKRSFNWEDVPQIARISSLALKCAKKWPPCLGSDVPRGFSSFHQTLMLSCRLVVGSLIRPLGLPGPRLSPPFESESGCPMGAAPPPCLL